MPYNEEQQPRKESWGLGLAKGLGADLASGAINGGLGLLLGRITANWQDKRQLKQQGELQKMQMAGQKEMMDY